MTLNEQKRPGRDTVSGMIRELLARHLETRPCMAEEDVVKFVFQAMLGVGHSVSSEERVLGYLREEMKGLGKPDPDEPLTEQLSPEWFRINLRPAKAAGFREEDISRMVFLSAQKACLPFGRCDVYGLCVELDDSEKMRNAAEKVLDVNWIPSHSDRYRELYRPAYRVLHADLISLIGTGDPNPAE